MLSVITSKRLVHTTSRHGSSSPSNPGVPDISYAGDSPQYVEKLDQRVSHTPVMVSEVIDILQPQNGKVRRHGSFARQYWYVEKWFGNLGAKLWHSVLQTMTYKTNLIGYRML